MKSENYAVDKELGVLVPEIIALVGGIISAIIFVIPISVLLGFLGILTAPLVEEPSKVIGLIFLALYYPHALTTKKRGMVLGGLAGLGFAFTENFLYLIRAETGVFGEGAVVVVSILRAIFPVSMHILASALVGCGLVLLAKKNFDRSRLNISTFLYNVKSQDILSFLVISMILHFQYNFLSSMIGLIGIIIGIGVVFLIFYKLYYFLPERLETQKITDPLQLLSDAVNSKKGKPIDQIISNVIGSSENKPVKFCSKCGTGNPSGASFCQKCGNRIKK